MADYNMEWAGEGFCQARSIAEENDWCNKPTGNKFCVECTCIIQRCVQQQVASYPLLPGNPRFCSRHHNEEYAGKFGCDFSESDHDPGPWGD